MKNEKKYDIFMKKNNLYLQENFLFFINVYLCPRKIL